MDLSQPLFALDPFAADAQAEAARLLAAGAVVPVDVIGVPVWPLMKIITAQYIGTADGAEHRRLRNDLLDRLAASPAHEVADLKAAFAVPLPTGVICELLGVPDERHGLLHSLCHALFDTTEQPAEVTATEEALHRFMAELAASKAADPGDDLTSMLVEHHTSGSITHDELIDTLILVLTAGHQTTINFFTNSLLALMIHPDQLAQVRAGEPVMMSYAALGRDPAHHGPLAASFDVARDTRHLSFGHGPHFCVGAPLALNGVRALPATIRPRQKAVAGG